MNKQDARKLDHKGVTDLRRPATNAVQGGERPEVIARVFGVSRGALYGWLSGYRHGGWDVLDARKRGGRPRKLYGRALRWIYTTVAMKNRLQLRFSFALAGRPKTEIYFGDEAGVRSDLCHRTEREGNRHS
jgi:transposase